jgi:hypothetical protein
MKLRVIYRDGTRSIVTVPSVHMPRLVCALAMSGRVDRIEAGCHAQTAAHNIIHSSLAAGTATDPKERNRA